MIGACRSSFQSSIDFGSSSPADRNPIIRPGRDSDADGFIAMIAACWGEYPGIVIDIDGELPELRALASHYAGKGGALWAAEADGRVVGMIGVAPRSEGVWEILRLYMLQPYRGSDLAPRLLATAETHARAAGATRLVLWSDTRFDRAHRFYEKHSYIRHGPIGVLHDISNSLEFGYAKPVSGIEVLDTAAAASPSGGWPRSCVPASMPVHRCRICRRWRPTSRAHSGSAPPPMSPPARASCSRPGTTRCWSAP